MKHNVGSLFFLIVLTGFLIAASEGYSQDRSTDIQKNLELLQSENDRDRIDAARTLGYIGNETAVDGLITALKDSEQLVREEAARSLGMLKNPKAIDALLHTFQHDNRAVGMLALEGLAEIGDKRAVGPLMKELRLGSEGNVEEALSGTIRAIVGYLPVPEETIWEREYALERLADDDPLIKAQALYDLGEIRDYEALGDVQEALNNANPYVRAAALNALVKIPDPSSEPALISLLNDPDYFMRLKAKEALEAIGTQTAFQAVSQAQKKGAFKAPAAQEQAGTEEQQEPEIQKIFPRGLHQWGAYELSDYQPGKNPEHLNPGTYTLLKALDEIRIMLEEVEAQIAKHTRIYAKPTFLACYYVKKAQLPESELGLSVLQINEKGHITDFPSWLNHEMANISDIPFGGPYIPGLSTNKYSCMRYKEIRGKLKDALKYFKQYSQYYMENPPVEEMQHLRNMMAQWRSVVVAYHTALDAYLDNLAQWMVIKKYYGTTVYDQKKEAVEQKYPLRHEDDVQAAKYDIEIKAFEQWWEGLKQKMQMHYSRFDKKEADIWATKKIQLPQGLEEVFGPYVHLVLLNREYIEKSARLKKADKNSKEAKTISEALKELEKEISQAISQQQEKYGDTWKDRFRDKRGKLPGGMIKDGWLDRVKQMAGKEKPKKNSRSAAKTIADPGKDPFYEFLKQSLAQDNPANPDTSAESGRHGNLSGSDLNRPREYMEEPVRASQSHQTGTGVVHGMEVKTSEP